MNQQDQQERITLYDPQWYESGASLPAVQNAGLPVNRMQQPVAVPSNYPSRFDENDYKQIVIHVARLLERPLQSLRVLENYGQVYLVEFVPHIWFDPVLPVTSVRLGKDHDYAFRKLAELIAGWSPEYLYQRSWFQKCKPYARCCMIAAFECLPDDEAEYFSREMMYTMSNPDRRNLNVPAQKPAQLWR